MEQRFNELVRKGEEEKNKNQTSGIGGLLGGKKLMNKYELKYILEQQSSIVDRLTDSLGKQSTHIQELWTEIGLKNTKINNLTQVLGTKNEEIIKLKNIIKSQSEKNLAEYHFPELVDN